MGFESWKSERLRVIERLLEQETEVLENRRNLVKRTKGMFILLFVNKDH